MKSLGILACYIFGFMSLIVGIVLAFVVYYEVGGFMGYSLSISLLIILGAIGYVLVASASNAETK